MFLHPIPLSQPREFVTHSVCECRSVIAHCAIGQISCVQYECQVMANPFKVHTKLPIIRTHTLANTDSLVRTSSCQAYGNRSKVVRVSFWGGVEKCTICTIKPNHFNERIDKSADRQFECVHIFLRKWRLALFFQSDWNVSHVRNVQMLLRFIFSLACCLLNTCKKVSQSNQSVTPNKTKEKVCNWKFDARTAQRSTSNANRMALK